MVRNGPDSNDSHSLRTISPCFSNMGRDDREARSFAGPKFGPVIPPLQLPVYFWAT